MQAYKTLNFPRYTHVLPLYRHAASEGEFKIKFVACFVSLEENQLVRCIIGGVVNGF